ncbi:protein lethal(2)denticleless [Onthophagus taurus]|uniref:protein lethal(2)denticleless n=1 Tax=Onthophagus taurus TaxID=166361 RepID=UPI0039BE80EE
MPKLSYPQALMSQQMGLYNWRTCDSVMKRLGCSANEDFSSTELEDYNVDSVNSCDSPVFACKFAQQQGYEHILALANEDGRTGILDTKTMERTSSKVHYNAIFDVAWMFNQMKLVTASGDHSAKLVDVSNDGLKIVRWFTGHNRSVKTLAIKQDDSSVFASGGRDGKILLWDTRSWESCANFIAKPDKSIPYAHFKQSKLKKKHTETTLSALNSVTGLAFQDENTLISCGAGDGIIKLWDLRKTYNNKRDPTPKNIIVNPIKKSGSSNLIVDKTGSRLYVSCLDSIIYCYNILTCNPSPIMTYKGHRTNTFYVKSCLSNDGNYLLSGSSDQYAYIWNVNSSEPIVRLSGHRAEVTCVAWCHSGDTTLVTCADDFRHKIWRIGPETFPNDWNVIGKGQAQVLTPKIPIKRPFEPIENELKSFRLKSCEFCLDVSDMRRCENCGSNQFNLKRLNTSPKTPTKSKKLKSQSDPISVRSLFGKSDVKIDDVLLENLPNFNVDGSAPHLHHSPQKKIDRDWLTKLRTEKHILSPTSPRCERDESPRTRSAKKRKMERSESPHSPLLKFFRATNNSIMKDSNCCLSKAGLVQESTINT